jgi:hypothetical protein
MLVIEKRFSSEGYFEGMSCPAEVPEAPQALKSSPTAGMFARIAPSTLSKAASASSG